MSHCIFVGIDVSQDWLDVWLHPINKHFQVDNSPKGVQRLVQALAGHEVAKVVLEATGGLEYLAAKELQAAGLTTAVVNPQYIAAFRTMRGKYLKTDASDAETIALFAQKMDPEARPVATDQEQALKELTARRLQLLTMIGGERNRLQRTASPVMKRSIKKVLAVLEAEKAEVERLLVEAIELDEHHRENYRLLTSIPAIGPAIAVSLITGLPELGRLNKKEIAALVGGAPNNRESGKSAGKAITRGGRRCVRSALYMGALVAIRHNPPLQAFYQRLVANGKPKKLAIMACMRKLLIVANQIVKDRRPWQASYAMGA